MQQPCSMQKEAISHWMKNRAYMHACSWKDRKEQVRFTLDEFRVAFTLMSMGLSFLDADAGAAPPEKS